MPSNNIYTSSTTTCYHCGDACKSQPIMAHSYTFCCEGCKMVYEILQGNNLCSYYDLNSTPGKTQKIKVSKDKFQFLDNKEIEQKLLQFADGQKSHVQLYIPQMHCSSCTWLLENLYKLNDGIISSTVNFTAKEVFIIYNHHKTTLRKVAETLTSIGYEPHLNLKDVGEKTATTTNKQRIIKIGIAGFCFSNIMMLCFPEYLAGGQVVEPIIKKGLQVISIILSLPVLYAGNEFFVSAYKGIKNKYINIDAPVALAVAITFIRSLYEIFTQTGTGYLDSMSGVVFFMLVGRWLQERTYKNIAFDRDYTSFLPIALEVKQTDGSLASTLVSKVNTNDVVVIHNNEVIPIDGILSKGNALIDYSFVSGEQLPVQKEVGEIIYAGGKQLSGNIELLVVKPVSQSYLTSLWNNDAFKRKPAASANIIDAVGKYFTYIVLFIAGIAGVYWYMQHDASKMFAAITTVLIVACPCALLLASNYANGNVLKIFGKNGLYIRDASVLHDINVVNHIVFDKTGTLTHAQDSLMEYKGNTLTEEQIIEVSSVLSQSNHPLSKMVLQYLKPAKLLAIDSFKEHIGKGIEAWINDKHIKIGSLSFVSHTTQSASLSTEVYVLIDKEILGKYAIKNMYRHNIFTMLNSIGTKNKLSIISGDNEAEEAVLKSNVPTAHLQFNQSPVQKLDYINNLQQNKVEKIMMVGDGLNDAGALKTAHVGIAVCENVNNFTPACDAVIEANKINLLPKFISLVKTNAAIVFTTFAISFVYNAIGLWFSVQGILSPVIAAVLMPASTLTIVLLTYSLTKWAAYKKGLITN